MSERLMVQSGRNPPFHPRLFISPNSGYKRNQWCGVYFKPTAHCGEHWAANEIPLAELVEHYLKELLRTGHKQVRAPDRP
jgi:hypothetical protein